MILYDGIDVDNDIDINMLSGCTNLRAKSVICTNTPYRTLSHDMALSVAVPDPVAVAEPATKHAKQDVALICLP